MGRRLVVEETRGGSRVVREMQRMPRSRGRNLWRWWCGVVVVNQQMYKKCVCKVKRKG